MRCPVLRNSLPAWREGRKYACLSNSTLTPPRIVQRLRHMAIQIEPEHIFSAASATADYILQHYPPPRRIYNLANESMRELLWGGRMG